MNTNQPSAFKSIQLLFLAILVGQVLIGLILQFVVINFVETPTGLTDALKYGASLLPVLGFVGSIMLNKAMLASAGEQKELTDKLAHYRRLKITGWAIHEGANLITVVLAFLYQYQLFMYLFAFGVLLFALGRPSLDAFRDNYNVTDREMQTLGDA